MYTLKWAHRLEQIISIQEQRRSSRQILHSDLIPGLATAQNCRLFLGCLNMSFANAWRLCVLPVFLLAGVLAQDCRGTHVQEEINQQAQIVLNEMAPDAVRVVYQVLRQFSKIYSMNMASVTWPRDKVENLRLLLDAQVRELENCVRNRGSGTRPRRSAAIHNYFRKLSKFLKRKRFGACAWEVTRAETRASFQQLPGVMARISEAN
ncbi:interferon alpha-H-like [Rhinoraja longicauda]